MVDIPPMHTEEAAAADTLEDPWDFHPDRRYKDDDDGLSGLFVGWLGCASSVLAFGNIDFAGELLVKLLVKLLSRCFHT
jgi:hypothetical protein